MPADPDDERLIDLVARWQESIGEGRELSPEELCRDCPELLERLRTWVARLRPMNSILEMNPIVGASTASWTGPAGTADAPGAPPLSTEQAGDCAEASLRFVRLRRLGEGGLGEVYEARDEELGRTVALKEIRRLRAHDRLAQWQFVREAQVTGKLEHPGIIPVYGLGRYPDGRPFYAMRLILGPTLMDASNRFHADPRLEDDPGARSLELRKLLRHFLDVCNAIDYAHGRGVLHLDLKPDNVMLGRYGETQVVDWGLARSPTAAGTAGVPRPGVRGALPFLSPEQARGDPAAIGPASDIFGLGATLYYLLTGRAPYRLEEPQPGERTGIDAQLLRQVQEGRFPPPRAVAPTVPPALNAICLKAMRLRAGDRYPSPGALAGDVERWLADEPVSAYRDPWRTRAARWARRNKPTAAASIILLVVAVAALALGTFLIWREAGRARAAEQASTREASRARQAERRTQDLLAASYADAARLASQRGAWQTALADFDKALAAGHPDSIGIRLDKVRAWVALEQLSDAFHELEDLQGGHDLGKYEGQVLLWRVDLGHARNLGATAKRQLLRQAVDRGLDPADQAYAEGLLATTATEAIGRFRRALEIDPFHSRATDQLARLLILVGQREEARIVLAKAELLFPDDPSPRVSHALLLASEGDQTGAEEQLDRARSRANPAVFAFWQSAVRLIARYHDADALFLDRPGSDSGLGLLKLLLQVWRESGLGGLPSIIIDPDRMNAIDLPPFISEVLGRIGPKSALALSGIRQPLRLELDSAVKVLPTAELVLLRGGLLLEEGQEEAAEAAALQAAEMPSLVKVRRIALLAALTAEQRLLERSAPPPGLRDRIRRTIQALAATGDADPKRSAFLIGLAYLIREIDLARSVLDAWERRSPGDPDAQAYRAAIERHGGAYRRAITAAQQALRAKPGYRLAREALDSSLRLLRQDTRALAPALVSDPPPGAVDYFNLACAQALCAARPVGEHKSSPPGPTDQEAHADEAMAALKRAIDAGWSDAARIARDPDLESLRSRADFRELLRTLLDRTFPTDPFSTPP
jgi:tetratricopeptide (TPR) repeat protein